MDFRNNSMLTSFILVRQLTEQFYEENDSISGVNDAFVLVNKMPAHHTSGITEHRIGSQMDHMNQSIHTDWILNGLG